MKEKDNPFRSPKNKGRSETVKAGLKPEDHAFVFVLIVAGSLLAALDFSFWETDIFSVFAPLSMYFILTVYGLLFAYRGRMPINGYIVFGGLILGLIGAAGGMFLLVNTCTPLADTTSLPWDHTSPARIAYDANRVQRINFAILIFVCTATVGLIVFAGVYGTVRGILESPLKEDKQKSEPGE